MQRRRFRRTSLAGATALVDVRVRAQAWPNHPIRQVVPFPPGSLPDDTARLVAEPLRSGRALGWAVKVAGVKPA